MHDPLQIVFTILFRSNEMPAVSDEKLISDIRQKYDRLDFILSAPEKTALHSFHSFMLSLIKSQPIKIPYGLILPILNPTNEKITDQSQSILDLLNSIFQYDLAPKLNEYEKRNIIVLIFLSHEQMTAVIRELTEPPTAEQQQGSSPFDLVNVVYETDEIEASLPPQSYN